MKTQPRTARWQLERFLSALFLPDDLIELRFIESWVSQGKKKSRVARRAKWMRYGDIVSRHDDLTAFAKRSRANVYFGVCPRPREGDTDDQTIDTVRCVWCDIDDVTREEAYSRWEAASIPQPSIVVNSGSGIHGYWFLQRDLTTRRLRRQLGAMLPHFYRSFGGDHVQNLSRVMRPPGTVNYKDARNGKRPLPCTLCTCDPEMRYPLDTFSRWTKQAEQELRRTTSAIPSRLSNELLVGESPSRRAEALSLVRRLEKPSPDRSRRDFAIVCHLLRLGLAREEIWELVSDTSKFESDGRMYFDLTFTNAERSVLREGNSSRRLRAVT